MSNSQANYGSYTSSPLIKEAMEMTDFRSPSNVSSLFTNAQQEDHIIVTTLYVKFGCYQKSLRHAQEFVANVVVKQYELAFYYVFLQYETGRAYIIVAFTKASDLQAYQKSGATLSLIDAIKDFVRSVPVFETYELVSFFR